MSIGDFEPNQNLDLTQEGKSVTDNTIVLGTIESGIKANLSLMQNNLGAEYLLLNNCVYLTAKAPASRNGFLPIDLFSEASNQAALLALSTLVNVDQLDLELYSVIKERKINPLMPLIFKRGNIENGRHGVFGDNPMLISNISFYCRKVPNCPSILVIKAEVQVTRNAARFDVIKEFDLTRKSSSNFLDLTDIQQVNKSKKDYALFMGSGNSGKKQSRTGGFKGDSQK